MSPVSYRNVCAEIPLSVHRLSLYQCNMAAMIQLGQWFDYLRENDVYDNTKIIIVSDHGAYLSFPGMEFDADNTAKYNVFNDVNLYKSLLLVKDFDSHELTEDPAFMTNADTPAIAFSEIKGTSAPTRGSLSRCLKFFNSVISCSQCFSSPLKSTHGKR